MDEFLMQSESQRLKIFNEAGNRLGLPAASIEKDWWVTAVLEVLFTSPEIVPLITFKGGTSLSKAFNLIRRFSEDIDLVINRESIGITDDRAPEHATSHRQKIQRVKDVKHACADSMQKIITPTLNAEFARRGYLEASPIELDPDDSEHHRILIKYRSLFPSSAAPYVSAQVKVEVEARSGDEPSILRAIRPLIAEVFPEAGWGDEIHVRTLDPARTFLEKACILHEENFRPEGNGIKGAMSRHIYDLHFLMRAGMGERSQSDARLLERVVENRRTYFSYSWMNYDTMQPGSFTLVPRENLIGTWRNDYRSLRENMIYGDTPEFPVLIESLRKIESMLNTSNNNSGA